MNLASRIIHGVLFWDFPFYKVLQVTAMWYLSPLHQPRVPIRSFSWCVFYIPADSHWFQSHVIPAKVARIKNYVEHSTNSWCWLPSCQWLWCHSKVTSTWFAVIRLFGTPGTLGLDVGISWNLGSSPVAQRRGADAQHRGCGTRHRVGAGESNAAEVWSRDVGMKEDKF